MTKKSMADNIVQTPYRKDEDILDLQRLSKRFDGIFGVVNDELISQMIFVALNKFK